MRNKLGQFIKGFRSSPNTEFKKGVLSTTKPFKKGHKIRLGMKQSEKTKEKIRLKKRGQKHTMKTKSKMSLSHGGTGISVIATKRYYHLKDWRYKEWRSKVFERDNWTCQTCRKRGVELNAHHIKSWANYPEFRYDLNNGVTLCVECHKLTDNYKGKKCIGT